MLKLQNITKSFVVADETIQVLKGVSLEVRAGEFVAIMGQSGSGKSTLMNIIGLLDIPTSGSYELDGREIAELSEYEQSLIRRQKIGFIFQSYNLIPRMPVVEQVMLPLLYQDIPAPEARSRAMALLEQVGLAHKAENKPTELSGGQQQRVCIARSLVAEPSILLADEPTGALDSQTGIEIMELLKTLHMSGKTIILITHDPEIARIAERVVHIRDGLITS